MGRIADKPAKAKLRDAHWAKLKMSKVGGTTRTYYLMRDKKNKSNPLRFVRMLLNGKSIYIGLILENGKFILTKRSPRSTPSFDFAAMWQLYFSKKYDTLLNEFKVQVVTSIKYCRKCGQVLTTKESIERGIGPGCAKKERTLNAYKGETNV